MEVPDDVREAFQADDPYFPTALQKFVAYTNYTRFDEKKGRRETWIELVDRVVSYLRELSNDELSERTYRRIRKNILSLEVLPSMRLLAMAGPAARRNNITLYNCSYIPVNSIDVFHEALYISMSGCGVGFSVEDDEVAQLPPVVSQPHHYSVDGRIHTGPDRTTNFTVPDSAEGWAQAVQTGIQAWFTGYDIVFDYSQVRPQGAVLKTKGGRASGPAPLEQMLDFMRSTILGAQGRKLTPLEAHDMMCAVGEAAVSGGVRRTAMISLQTFGNREMLEAKNGDLINEGNTRRFNANNSVVWPEQMTQTQLLEHLTEMFRGERGEPAIFNRAAAQRSKPDRRGDARWGTNPCGEIILRPAQFCNLTAIVARPWDTVETLKEKIALAAIIGTIQAKATKFPILRPIWTQNCEEEALLGVDITGQVDCPVLNDPQLLRELRSIAIKANQAFAKKLRINPAAAVTCVKPSGNSSQLVNCSSGMHPRWAPYYIRRVRVSADSPVRYVLDHSGVPLIPEIGHDPEHPRTYVVEFPVKAPEGAITRKDISAIELCERWLVLKTNYTEHNPSVTIPYRPNEIIDLLQWIWANRDRIGGMTFLPTDDARYELSPYEDISQEEYERRIESFPYIDWSMIHYFEQVDMTTSAQEIACFAGGSCEI